MATATSDAKRIAGRRYVLAAIAAVAAIAVTAVAVALSGRPPGRAFPPLHPAAAPAGWRHATLPNGTAVLSYPPSLHPIEGDTGTVSAARQAAVMSAASARVLRRLDVAVAIAGTAVVIRVMIPAVALRDGIGGRRRGRRRGGRGGCGAHRREMAVLVRRSGWLGRG